MLKSVAIDYFNNEEGRSGASKLAMALRVSEAAVSKWPETIPELSARRIHDLVRGHMWWIRIPNHGRPLPTFENEDYQR